MTPPSPLPGAARVPGRWTGRWWRFIQFPLVRLVLGFFWVGGSVALSEALARRLPASVQPLSSLVLAGGACLGYGLFVRWVERRPVVELAGPGALAEFTRGLAIGAALFAVTIGLLYLLGVYTVTAVRPWSAAAPALLAALMTALMAGVFEELLVRGIVFRIVEAWLGSGVALALSAGLFGAMHLPNPHAGVLSAVAVGLEAGVLLAAAYMLTRRLWLAIGIHLAWNFTQSGLFGVATSGVEQPGWIQGTLQGPPALSGGAFGAEASAVAVAVCLSAGLFMLWRAHRRGRFIRGSAWRAR